LTAFENLELGLRVVEVWEEMVNACQCQSPLPYVRPSGELICLHVACGLPIRGDAPSKKVKP